MYLVESSLCFWLFENVSPPHVCFRRFCFAMATDITTDLATAAARLRDGGLVAFPTETVYGLGADASNDRAVAGIYAAKGRPSFNPLIVHCYDLSHAEKCVEFSDVARKLAEKFWPGPLTIVLPRRKDCSISLLVSAGLPTVGVRVPAHPIAAQLIRESGCFVAAPSANKSGKISPTTAQHVLDSLGAGKAMILDGGAYCDHYYYSIVCLLFVVLPQGATLVFRHFDLLCLFLFLLNFSMLFFLFFCCLFSHQVPAPWAWRARLSICRQTPTLLRPGGVVAVRIWAFLGPVRASSSSCCCLLILLRESVCCLLTSYQTCASLLFLPPPPSLTLSQIVALSIRRSAQQQRPLTSASCCHTQTSPCLSITSPLHRSLRPRRHAAAAATAPPLETFQLSASGDLQEAAANLFRMLHEADAGLRRGNGHCGGACLPPRLGLAMNDRLQRAAADRRAKCSGAVVIGGLL